MDAAQLQVSATNIQKGWNAVVESGLALALIRDNELFRKEFELLVLVGQKAAYEILTQKIEELHQHILLLFEPTNPNR